MAKWEYTQVILKIYRNRVYGTSSTYINDTPIADTPYNELSQIQLANELGKQGWELISDMHMVTVDGDITQELETLWFKRQVE